MNNRIRIPGESIDFKTEKKHALKVARQLCYKPIIIAQIQNATTSMQISRALRAGRAM